MIELIINQKSEKIEVCILEDGKICELYVYSDEKDNTMGNIYLGKVKNVVDGMQAAFIDIGMEKNAFISVKDAAPKVDVAKETQVIDFKISDVMKQNENLLVQVKKTPTTEKGARVSTHITLPGDYLVLMPNFEVVTVSQKISSEEERDRLVKIVDKVIQPGFGAIIRTDAEGAKEENLIKDLRNLENLWNTIEKKAKSEEVCLVYDEHELISKIGRDIINQKLDKIYVNNESLYRKFTEYLNKNETKKNIPIEFLNVKDIINEFGLKSELSSVDNRKVWLKNGGYIVIDKTEALTAIDVNSGKFVGNSDLEKTALDVNLEAAKEIMRQIRLKDIGGIIVIDYIDLNKKEHQKQVIEAMNAEILKDRSRIDIKGYTELNLVELTRKRMNI